MGLSKKVKILLVYELPSGNMPIAEVRDPKLLQEVKKLALEEAKTALVFLSGIDPIVRIDRECQLLRKKRILNRLIPMKTEGGLK